MSELLSIISGTLSYWWVIFPLVFIVIARDWWLINITENYLNSMEWTLLEIIIPKENIKSSRAMEQVITSLHATYSFGIKRRILYKKGKVEDWMSLELVGFADGIHMYIRTLKAHKHLVESAILAQYPEAEVLDAEDYVERLKEKPFSDRDIFGTDFLLAKGDHLPIKTYTSFEDKDEEKNLDPLASITEVMTRLKKNEALWLQLLIRPTGDGWRDKAKDKVEELIGNKKSSPKASTSVLRDVGDVVKNLPVAVFTPPAYGEGDKPGGSTEIKKMSVGDQDAVKSVSGKISKLAFDSILRFVYIDDKAEFTTENVTAVNGAIRQFGDQNLNQLVPNMDTITLPKGMFNKAKKLAFRKRVLMTNYIERAMPRPVKLPLWDLNLKTSVLNTEEIASLFHPPTNVIRSEKLQAIKSKKGIAPIDLPTKEK